MRSKQLLYSIVFVYLGLRHQPSDPELQELGNVVEDRAQGDRDNVAFPHRHAVTELKTRNQI